MRVSVLGPLQLEEAGREIPTGGTRQRAVLAYLALVANQVVPSERLLVDLWGQDSPPGAGNALHAAVSRLRKVLPAGRLVTQTHGYMLRLLADELDSAQFETAFARGRNALAADDGRDAARILRDALALWRGPALADFRYEPFAQTEIARLEELELACRQARIDADLAAGAAAELVPELRLLVAEHPLREQPRAQLMLALYRTGRQAEALDIYRETRNLLRQELGLEPSAALARLETAILRHDPSLEPPRPTVPPPTAFTRRPVTVLCIDVVPGSTTAGALDPETLQVIGARLQALLGPILERFGGQLSAPPGQRLLGAFGVVSLHEDDAQRGASAALECRRTLLLEAAALQQQGTRLAFRVGIATAEAMVTHSDPPSFVGEAVGLAEALADAAELGQVLVSEHTYRLAAGALDVERAASGRLILRSARFGVRSLPVRLEARVVGRTPELRRLEEVCAAAGQARSTALVTVIGEAGMGKTRTVHELARRLDGRATLLTGRCLPYGEGITFWPLRELVRQATGGGHQPDAIEALLDGDRDAGTIAARLGRAFGSGEPGTADTAEIFWATRRLLEVLARRRLLVVVLEDLHWAEPTFLDLIESLVEQPAGAPIVVLALTRPELLEQRPAWAATASAGTVIEVQPLTDDDAGALLDELCAPATVPLPTRRRLIRTAGGNPLYLEQLIASLDEQHWVEQDAPLPPTIQALLAARLDRLGPAERAVLACASVVGKEFGATSVAALLPAEIGRQLTWHLRTLVAKGLVQAVDPDRGEPEEFSFRHILIQQAAYRAVLKSARAQLHERVADWMEQDVGERSSQWVEVLGHHLEQAARYRRELQQEPQATALAGRATTYLRVAGRSSLALGDAAAAVSAFERAGALLSDSDPDRAPVLTGLGAALVEVGRLNDAKTALDSARRLAAAQGQDGFGAHAQVQALLLDLHLDPGAATARIQQAVPALRATFGRDGDELGLCRTWQLEAAVHWNRARSAEAEQAWERAADCARAADDQRHLTRSLRWLASAALWGPTPAGLGITRCESYLREIGSTPTGRAVIFLHMAGLFAMSDHLGTARDLLARGAAILQDVGSMLPSAITEPAAFVAMLTGDAAAAEQHLRTGYDWMREIGEQADLSTTAALLARAVVLQGPARHDEAEALVTISWEAGAGQDLSAVIIGNGVRARVLADRGDHDAAIGLAGEAVGLASDTDFLHQHADASMDLGQVLAVSGRRHEARKALLAARELYEAKGSVLGVRGCDRLLAAGGAR